MAEVRKLLRGDQDFKFGGPTPATAYDCCGKPVGCTNTNPGCGFLKHPWKRACVFNDPDAPCQMKWWPDPNRVETVTCSLKINHSGPCVPK